MHILNADWHGVPAGTQVVVTNEFTDIQGDRIAVVKRADGKMLPTSWGKAKSTYIAYEFLANA